MTSLEVVALILGSGGVGAILSALVNLASNRGQVRVDEFRAITGELNNRINDLKGEVDDLNDRLDSERAEHEVTRARFRSALRYIRAMLSWVTSGRRGEPPSVPLELMDDL